MRLVGEDKDGDVLVGVDELEDVSDVVCDVAHSRVELFQFALVERYQVFDAPFHAVEWHQKGL